MRKPIANSLLLISLVFAPIAGRAEAGSPITKETFDAWMQEISNWQRWGADDELGTLNLITPAKRKAAAQLVRNGVSISLSLALNTEGSEYNPQPFEHELSTENFGAQSGAVDRYCIAYHGAAHSHLDGLPHVMHEGTLYNGVSAQVLKPNGAEKLGVHNMKEGIFSRGVLVDMAWHKGVDYLEPGTPITIADLENWEAKTGVTLQSGDVLLLRTGRWQRQRVKGPVNMMKDGAAGFHASVAKWLRARDIAALGSDSGADLIPSGVEGKPVPLHELVLVGLGMPMLDNLDLETLSNEAQARERWTFLFIAAPLRVEGGTGSPVNPLAVF